MTDFPNIVYENYITNKIPLSEKEIMLESVIPVDDGSFTINSLGVLDIEGDLLMIGVIPKTYVPTRSEGSTKELLVHLNINVDSADNIKITIDPTVTLVTQSKLEETMKELLSLLDNKVEYSELDDAISDLIGEAPEMLDTLQELAEALDNDPNFAATMTRELSKKVDKEEGRGLSTNDFTDAFKEKLELLQHITKISQLKQDIPYLLDADLEPLRVDIKSNTSLINSEIERVINIINNLDIPEEVDLESINTKLKDLQEKKLDKLEFESKMTEILAEIKSYLEEELTKINNRLEDKANKSDIPKLLSELEDDIDLNKRLNLLETGKASITDLQKVKSDLEQMINDIDIPEVDLTPIQEELVRLDRVKANKTDVENIIKQIEALLEQQLIEINKKLEGKADTVYVDSEVVRIEKMIQDIVAGDDSEYIIPRTTDSPIKEELFYKKLRQEPPVSHWRPDDWGIWEVVNQNHLKCKASRTYDALSTRLTDNDGVVKVSIKKVDKTDRHILTLRRDGELIVDIRETRGDKDYEFKVKAGDELRIVSLFEGEVFLEYLGEPEATRLYAYKNGKEERIANARLVEKELDKYITREDANSKVGNLDELDTADKSNLVEAINEINAKEINKEDLVTSVNEMKGDVELDAHNLNVSPGWSIYNELSRKASSYEVSQKADKKDIPIRVSQLENDKGFITQEEIPAIDKVIPRVTEDYEESEIHIHHDFKESFEVRLDKATEGIVQEDNKFIVKDIDGYASIEFTIVEGAGEFAMHFEDVGGYYSYTIYKVDGERIDSGWLGEDSTSTHEVKSGDRVTLNIGDDLIFYYDKPKQEAIKALYFEGSPVNTIYDDSEVMKDIGNLKKDVKNKINKSEVSEVGKSGKYDDILNKPSIPSKLSDLEIDMELGKDYDKEIQDLKDNKVEMVNNIGGKNIQLYGNFIDTKWGSNVTVTDALETKASRFIEDEQTFNEYEFIVKGGIPYLRVTK